MVPGPWPCCDCTSGRFLSCKSDTRRIGLRFRRYLPQILTKATYGASKLKGLVSQCRDQTTALATDISVFASKRYYGEKAESEPVPGLNTVRRPVSAVVTLRGDAFVALQRAGKVWEELSVARRRAERAASLADLWFPRRRRMPW
jgi:hypothetical protein